MVERRWVSVAHDAPITCVAPHKPVRPEMLLYEGAKAPDLIEVRRTYETIFKKLLKYLSGSSTRRVVNLARVSGDSRVARFEEWPAAHFEPLERPTHLFYRDMSGIRKDRSSVLVVTPGVEVETHRSGMSFSLSDPTGAAPGVGVEIPIFGEKTLKVAVVAPVDPVVEVFALSPAQSIESVSLEAYLDSRLSGLESELERDPEFDGDPEKIRSEFERVYEPFVAGDGEAHVEVDHPVRTVGPGEPEKFDITIRPEREGAMMLAIGARIRSKEGERVSMSELLPLRWRPPDWEIVDDETEGLTFVGNAPENVRVKVPAAEPSRKRAIGE